MDPAGLPIVPFAHSDVFLASRVLIPKRNALFVCIAFVNAKLASDVWVCDGNSITTETMQSYFNESPAVVEMIASQDAKRSVLARTVSINAHARETTEEIKEIKTVLFTLAKMVSFHCSVHRIHRIDLSCPPPPTRRWRSSTRNSTRSCPPPPTRKVRAHHNSQ